MKKNGLRMGLCIGVMFLCALFAVGCAGGTALKINCPTDTLKVELGNYVLPEYDVTDEQGIVQAGFTVRVGSVTDGDGQPVDVIDGTIMANKAGIYSVVYTADSKKVKDATLKLDFARRRAPTVTVKPEAIPQYYVRGFTYRIPAYTITDEPDLSKCYAKVFYKADNNSTRQEVALTEGQFSIDNSAGVYEILIHAEDALGNGKDESFFIPAIGPKEVVDGRVLYFDQTFGEAQIKGLWNTFKYGFSADKAYGDEEGSLKLVTEDVNDYFLLDKLLIQDVSAYTHLVFHVYNDSSVSLMTGFAWFGDTVLVPGQWTEVKIPIAVLDTKAVNVKNEQAIKATDITGLSFRLWATTGSLAKGSTVYISNVDAIKDESGPRTDDVIANFGEAAFDSSQVKTWYADGALSTEQKLDGQEGSLKITKTEGTEVYIELLNPFILDITPYDYVTYSVFNPNAYAVTAGYKWCGDTQIQPNSWGEVKLAVSGFKAIDPATTANIISLQLRFQSLEVGDSLYVSSIEGGMEEIEGLITAFGSAGLDAETSLLTFGGTGAFSEEQAYESEQGSFKFVKSGAASVEGYVELAAPGLTDVTPYDYVIFRVYNAGSANITAGYKWCGDTVVAPGEWVDVKVAVSAFKSIEPATTSDITHLTLRFQGMEDGSTLYISNMIAANEEA